VATSEIIFDPFKKKIVEGKIKAKAIIREISGSEYVLLMPFTLSHFKMGEKAQAIMPPKTKERIKGQSKISADTNKSVKRIF